MRSLANGTAEIDPRETIDAAYVDGRFYAAKAPGLAMFTLPWYGLLRAVGLQSATLDTDAATRGASGRSTCSARCCRHSRCSC